MVFIMAFSLSLVFFLWDYFLSIPGIIVFCLQITSLHREVEKVKLDQKRWETEPLGWFFFFFFFLHHFALCGSSRMYIASKPVLNCRSFSFQIGSGARLHSVSAERAWRLVDPSGGVCEGTEWDYLFAACRWRTGEDVRQKSVWTCAETD